MSENSAIEWTDHTFNPWEGCQKVGPGCDHCYAETRNARFAGGTAINWGPGAPRRRTSAANWKKPLQWNVEPFWQCGCGWRGSDRQLDRDPESASNLTDGVPACPSCNRIDLTQARQRVFCASLADVFDNAVDQQWRADLFELIEKTPNLDWLLLTKRISNVERMVPEACDLIEYGEGWQSLWGQGQWPANVWLGATVVNQEEADRDIPKLLRVPAARRFLSMEPLLGPVNLRFRIPGTTPPADASSWDAKKLDEWFQIAARAEYHALCETMDWVIVGGESGAGARPMHPSWARSLRDQCEAAGVPFLFKQWGEWVDADYCVGGDWTVAFLGDGDVVAKVGKKLAGRLLDGVQHDGYPVGS